MGSVTVGHAPTQLFNVHGHAQQLKRGGGKKLFSWWFRARPHNDVPAQPHHSGSITLSGFDPEGEPELQPLPGGVLRLVFNFVPPSWTEDAEEAFADFESEISKAIGRPSPAMTARCS
jgi:hypothetical protein